MNADTRKQSGACMLGGDTVPLARVGCGAWYRGGGGRVSEMGALLFVLLSLASPASALLPLAAVVLQAAGFYRMRRR